MSGQREGGGGETWDGLRIAQNKLRFDPYPNNILTTSKSTTNGGNTNRIHHLVNVCKNYNYITQTATTLYAYITCAQ